MATESLNTWNEIRDGAGDVERMIGHKQYNLAMIRARQTLELMIKSLCDRYKLSGADLSEKIDVLYKNRIITKTTAEHYHKIRMIGNRAAHEGDDNATGANTAYHLLSQELYTFANDFNSRRPAPRNSGRKSSSRQTRGNSFFDGLNWELIFKIMIPVVIIILIIALILVLKPGKKKDKAEETEAEMQTTVATMAETLPPVLEPTIVATEPETTKAPGYWVTTTGLKVRTEPNTDCDYVAILDEGTVVDFIDNYDDEWAVINHEGVERYVSRQYLVEKEGTPDSEPAEGSPE